MKQRVLSLLLVFAMLLQFMPAVYAQETDTPVYQAAYTDALTLNGDPTELAWTRGYSLKDSGGTQTLGTVAFLWNKAGIYLSVRYADAQQLSVEIAGKQLTVDLAAKTATGTGSAAVSEKGNSVEVSMTWSELGIALLDYGQIISGITVELSKDGATAAITGSLQILSNTVVAVPNTISAGNDSKNGWRRIISGNVTAEVTSAGSSTISFDLSAENFKTHSKGNITRIYRNPLVCVDHSKDLLVSQDLYFESLPVSVGTDSKNNQPSVKDGFYFTMSYDDGSDGTADGIGLTTLAISVYKADDGKLYLKCMSNPNSPVCLDRTEKQSFRLSMLWKTDESCTVYVDGVEKAVFSSGTYNTTTALGAQSMNIGYNQFTETSAKFTVSNVSVQTPGAAATLDSATTADILGSDLYLTEDLPSTWEFSSVIGSVPLTWSSVPEGCVTADGKLVKTNADQNIELTAFVGSVSLGTVNATVASRNALSNVEAMPAKEIILDGKLDDINWGEFYQLPAASDGMPSGIAAIAYNKNGIYLGVKHANANTLTVTLADKTVVVNLTDGTVTGAGTAVVTANAAELNITWEQLGVNPTDYGYSISGFSLALGGESGSTALTNRALPLVLTAREIHNQALNGYTTNNPSGVVTTANSVVFNAEAKALYPLYNQKNPVVDHSRDILLQQDIRVDAMPVITASTAAKITNFSTTKNYDCYHFWLSDYVSGLDNGNQGLTIVGVIYCSNEAGDLVLRIPTGDRKEFPLGKKVREPFRLQVLWRADGSAEIFVDGYHLGSMDNATAAAKGSAEDAVYLRYANVEGPGGKVSVSNVSLAAAMVESVAGEITPAAVLASIDTTNVQVDMDLPATYVNKYLGEIPLTWKSSDPSILGDDGKINDYANATVQLTCYVGETALWTVDVNISVLPEEPAGPAAASPDTITAAFSASEIVLNGELDDEGWIMNGNVLGPGNIKAGEFGAQWQDGKLYMAIETREAQTLTLTLGGKTVTINPANLTASGDFEPTLAKAEDDTVVELSVSFADLGLTVEDYNVLVPVTVVLDGSSYQGNLKLTSVDWFATENKAHPLPAPLKGNGKYGQDKATDHQGYEQINDGWRLFDLYNPDGANPTQVRSYVILTNNDLYNGWLTHDQTFHAEFDFLAKSLPVYDSSVTGWNENQACYGVPFFISDDTDSGNRSNCVSMGIINTVEGLAFVLLTKGGGSEIILLEKELGEQFRIGLSWRLGGTLILYIDGEEFAAFENAEENRYAFAKKGIGFNTIRSTQAAQSSADDMDVYITNIALGKSYDDSLLDNLTFDDIKGDNLDPDQIISQLTLPTTLSTPQLTEEQSLTWTTSNAQAIGTDGSVVRPATGGAMVTLTATLPSGASKDFQLVVLGLSNDSGNVLVVYEDLNPGNGAGAPIEVYPFTLDTTNNSVIIDLEESQNVNVAKLIDGDAFARLNEENLTLWYSDDNVTYTEIKHFRLLHKGNNWYLYDFNVKARYIKVHCTHFDGLQADFVGEAATMLTAYYEDVFGAQGGTFTESSYSLTNNDSFDWKDKAITVSKTDLGVVGSGIRVYMDDSLLYHYVDGENVTFRVDDLAAGESATLRILSGNADALDIANKEFVYEVTYGAKEASMTHARWLLQLPGDKVLALKTVKTGTNGMMYSTFSNDGGRTWGERTPIAATEDWITRDGGGFLYNPEEPDRIIFAGFYNNGFVSGDITQSDAGVNFIISEDGGQTWRQLSSVPKPEGDIYANYMITYSNGTLLAGNDGDGPNIDYVLPIGAQYNNDGGLCGRIAYSADNGLSWTLSESLITLGRSDNFEGGCSEMTIEQREDGVLVLLSRCENTESRHFAQAYSYDFGVTWEDIKYSSNYSVNTQPMFYRYDGAPLMVWGGNNALGGEARVRAPMSIAVSHDGMENFSNILDLYSKYSFQGMTKVSMNRITNPSVNKGGEDTLLISWANLFNKINSTPTMRVYDFTDYFYRTKGAYDSFEHGTVRYEGWEGTAGTVKHSNAQASDGSYSMHMGAMSEATRSIPYLQEGRIELDVYVADVATFEVELQSAYSNLYDYCAPVGLRVEDNVVTFIGADSASGLTLKQGWNTIAFDLKLNGDEPFAAVSVNGDSEAMPMKLDIGNYICYITISSESIIYVDNVLVEDTENALVYMESPASIAMSKINAIGEVTVDSGEKIAEAREAYDALTKEQSDLVTNLSVLEAAEAKLASLKEARAVSYTLLLKDYIGINFYMHLSDDVFAQKDAYMLFTGADGHTEKVTVADCYKRTSNGVTTYGFTYYVAAKEMADVVKAQFFYNNGESSTAVYTYSVRQYAEYVMAHSKQYGEELCQLVKDMLQYGAYAQLHFDHNAEDLANKNVKGASDIDAVTADVLSSYSITNEYRGPAGVQLYTSSLFLEANTTLRFYFTVTDEAVWNATTFTLAGKTLDKQHNDGKYYVDVTGIAAKNLHDVVTLDVSCGEESGQLRSSPVAYCYNVLNCTNESIKDYPHLQDVVRSLYLYNRSATAFFKN